MERADFKTRFKPGNPGSPGRPKGSRPAFSQAFIVDLYEDWKAHGIQALEIVREARPSEYLRIVAMVATRYDGFNDIGGGFHDEAIEELIEERRQQARLMIEKMNTPNGKDPAK